MAVLCRFGSNLRVIKAVSACSLRPALLVENLCLFQLRADLCQKPEPTKQSFLGLWLDADHGVRETLGMVVWLGRLFRCRGCDSCRDFGSRDVAWLDVFVEGRKTQRRSSEKEPGGSRTIDCGGKQSHIDCQPPGSCSKPRARSRTIEDSPAKTHPSATGEIGFRSKLLSPAVSRHMVWRGRQGEREFFVGHRFGLECCRVEGVLSCQHGDIGSERKALWFDTSSSDRRGRK
jgi:hypothetical protein